MCLNSGLFHRAMYLKFVFKAEVTNEQCETSPWQPATRLQKKVASTKANMHMSSGVAATHTSLVFVDMMEDNANLKETH